MSSVITPVEDRILFGLSKEDLKLIDSIELIGAQGESEINVVMHKLCVMQVIELAMTPPEQRATPEEEAAFREWLESHGRNEHDDYIDSWLIEQASSEMKAIIKKFKPPSDRPVCVSKAITTAMIAVNDSEYTTNENRQKLKAVVEEVMNTCPVQRKVQQLKTKVKVTDTRMAKNEAYREAEKKRESILKPIEDKYTDGDLSFDEAIALIREAAALYRADIQTV